MKALVVFLCLVQNSLVYSRNRSTHFEFSMNDFVKEQGYPLEVHTDIKTEDGYLLSIHRIPHGKKKQSDVKPKPGENKSLAFLLADRGYDVWLGNARGTQYSSKHVKLDPVKDKDFWDFSLHEIGYYDLPAILLYVKNMTKVEKITYVGYSQGGSNIYMMGSTRPEFGKFFNLVVGLAPGVFYGLEGNVLNDAFASLLFQYVDSLRDLLGIYNFGPQIKDLLCSKATTTAQNCFVGSQLFSTLIGVNLEEIQKEVFERSLGGFLQPVSLRQVFHYMQFMLRAQFRHYDYGFSKNKQKYGQSLPPFYNLSKINFPSAIFYGNADYIVTPANTKRLIRELPNVVYHELVPHKYFNHYDFLVSKDAASVLYHKVLDVIDQYSNK